MTFEDSKPWRKKILLDLQERNRRQCDPFAELIKSRELSLGFAVRFTRFTSAINVSAMTSMA